MRSESEGGGPTPGIREQGAQVAGRGISRPPAEDRLQSIELFETVNEDKMLVIEPAAALMLGSDLQKESLEPGNVPVLCSRVKGSGPTKNPAEAAWGPSGVLMIGRDVEGDFPCNVE